MNNDLTIKGKAFNLVYSDQKGSLRRSTTDGATRPHTLKIAHQDSVDSATKVPTIRSSTRFDYTHLDTGGVNPSPKPVTCYMVLEQGKGQYAPSSADIQMVISMLVQVLSSTAADASALNLANNIGVNKEQ